MKRISKKSFANLIPKKIFSGRRITLYGFSAVIAIANIGPITTGIGDYIHYREINSQEYMEQNGRWDIVNIPAEYKINAIHGALLHTGKILIVAGSGNDAQNFASGSFKTILYDPDKGTFKNIATPADFFCSGHAFLPDGRLLIAGGTQRYEILAGAVTNAAGAITVKNEDPDSAPIDFKKGQIFTGDNKKQYRATNDFTLPPATKMMMGGEAMVHASSVVVWAEAVEPGDSGVVTKAGHYALSGLKGDQKKNIYGQAEKFTMEKQDYQGLQESYVFDPIGEKYDRIDDMTYKRWYPTLVGLGNGDVLASSGLDGTGQILNGQTEILDHNTLQWNERTDLTHYFPTYPALFLTAEGKLFFSGSNTGYGAETKGRTPGIWDLTNNSFNEVLGLRDPQLLETSGSVMLPPVQEQKVMVVGGGGVGESNQSTTRTDIADLTADEPYFYAGPNLTVGTRYPNSVLLPDDTVLITGGSSDYRGKGNSNNFISQIYQPKSNTFRSAASQSIGRNYHSAAILLPDGRVITMGSDPLYADAKNLDDGNFEQRLEIFTPNYLFKGARPMIRSGAENISRGQSFDYTVNDGSDVQTMRLMRPSAATHATDVEQRSIALELTTKGNIITAKIPESANIAPSGWYMLTATNKAGVPSVAKWVHLD